MNTGAPPMSDDRTKSLRYIIPIEKIPGTKRGSGSVYDEIVKEFLDSKLKYAEVTLTTKAQASINAALRRHIKLKAIKGVKVRYMSKKVYLEREGNYADV